MSDSRLNFLARIKADLARIFREFGEEPRAAQVARAIVARRAERPWTRTGVAPKLTAQPSILCQDYHGWLRDGVLVPC